MLTRKTEYNICVPIYQKIYVSKWNANEIEQPKKDERNKSKTKNIILQRKGWKFDIFICPNSHMKPRPGT